LLYWRSGPAEQCLDGIRHGWSRRSALTILVRNSAGARRRAEIIDADHELVIER